MDSVRKEALKTLGGLRREIVQFAQQIIRIRSICSEDQKSVTDFIASKYRELGFDTSLVEDVKTKINVVSHMKGAGRKKSIGYYSHHDTMPVENFSDWEYDPWGAEIVDGRILGLGAADCKGGIAAAFGMALAFREVGIKLGGDLTLVSCMGEVTSEEVGMKSVVKAGHFNVTAAVQGDPTPSDQGIDSITTHHYGLLVLNVIYSRDRRARPVSRVRGQLH
jgi:acetylornithine deacetylase/succinyl-diaminopimelate desuccinylase-like protein